jgi:hypothetical protein
MKWKPTVPLKNGRYVGWVGMKWKPTVPLKNEMETHRSVEKWWVVTKFLPTLPLLKL